jgi:hypothetical protein
VEVMEEEIKAVNKITKFLKKICDNVAKTKRKEKTKKIITKKLNLEKKLKEVI